MYNYVTIDDWEKNSHNIYRSVRLFEPVSCIYIVCEHLKRTILFVKLKFCNIFHVNTWTVASIVEKRKITKFKMYFV